MPNFFYRTRSPEGKNVRRIKNFAIRNRRVNASLSNLLGRGKLDLASAAAVVSQAYDTPAVQKDLAEVRAHFLAVVERLRDAEHSGPLRLSYGARKALPRYRAYLEDELAKNAEAQMVTHNFSLAGLEPGFGEKWIFGRLAIDTAAPGGPVVHRAKVDSLVVNEAGFARVVSAGDIENLTDTQGSKTGIDRDLRKSLADLPLDLARGVFDRTSLHPFAFVKDAGGKAELESLASEAIGAPEHLEAVRKGHEATLDVGIHDITSPSCVSCHVTTSVRIARGLTPMLGAVARDHGLGLDNMDMTAVGPNTKLTQIQFKQTWLLRAFGYAGQTPSIADRTVREVEQDVQLATALRSKTP